MNDNPDSPTFYYRYEEDPTCGGITVRLRTFLMLRKTPHGAWITRCEVSTTTDPNTLLPWMKNRPRFVLDGSGKRFAHQELQWALESLKKRKEMQAWRCETSLMVAKKTLEALADPNFKVGENYPDIEIASRFGAY